MKKYFYSFAFVSCALALASCSNIQIDDEQASDKNPLILTVGTAGSETSRASIADGTYDADGNYTSSAGTVSIVWDKNEQLSLWPSSDLSKNVVMTYKSAGTFDNYAYFEAHGYTPAENEDYYVLYPYQSGATCTKSGDKTTITANIPHEQHAKSNSFDPDAAICTGTASYNQKSVTLAHACAFLKIHTTETCQSISVTTTDPTWYLAGDVNITPAASGSTIVSNDNKKNTVTLLPATGSTTIPAGTYLIAIAPGNQTPGIKATITYSSDNIVTETSKSDKINLTAGAITNMGTAPTK